MRRTARALSVAVLASAALGVCAGAGAADPGGVPSPPAGTGAGEPAAPPSADDPSADDPSADAPAAVPPPSAEEAVPPPGGQPAARVSPAAAAPGDTVTVSVSCGPTGGSAPPSLDATSAAFEEGTVALRKVADDGGTATGPTYRGTARIAAAGAPEPAPPDPEDAGDAPAPGDAAEAWTVDGACPDASGGEDGDPWSATMSVPGESGADAGAGAGAGAVQPGCRESAVPGAGADTRGTPCAPTTKPACPEPTAAHGGSTTWAKPCGGATTAEHGVQAGTGGAFGGSTTALVAGGVLIAGACGAAAHRLRLRLRGEDGER
ncbi:hypothetical protein ACFQ8O_32330 [Streptomyces coelicoflavus]|uniref:hypothetical protein n=1 Tax=Streptomyces coelicoflavus TaxID=285562 RepID=UPI0036C60EF3